MRRRLIEPTTQVRIDVDESRADVYLRAGFQEVADATKPKTVDESGAQSQPEKPARRGRPRKTETKK